MRRLAPAPAHPPLPRKPWTLPLQEAQERLDATTTSALGKTRSKALQLVATGRYMDPLSRVEAYNEALRAQKVNPGGNWEELVVQYGPEGAEVGRGGACAGRPPACPPAAMAYGLCVCTYACVRVPA